MEGGKTRIYKQNLSRLIRLTDFFGITDSSGLTPLSRIWDNGMLHNGKRSVGRDDHGLACQQPLVNHIEHPLLAETGVVGNFCPMQGEESCTSIGQILPSGREETCTLSGICRKMRFA